MFKPSVIIKTSALSLAAVVLFSAATPVIAAAMPHHGPSNHNRSVTAAETKDALADTGNVLGTSAQVSTQSDGDSAMVASTDETTLDAPKNAAQGVTFGANNGPKLEVDLPNADHATPAQQIAPGVVAYDSGNGSSNAVQANDDGSVRMLTVIDNPDAPTTYDYKVNVPDGGSVTLTPDGGALILDGTGQPITSVSSPWAKDAVGKQVKTYFTTDGQTLTQHVLHNVRGVVYPVTADPWWNPFSWFGGFKWMNGVKVLAKKVGPWYAVSCLIGGTWAWYRSDAQGWVRVGDAVIGCAI